MITRISTEGTAMNNVLRIAMTVVLFTAVAAVMLTGLTGCNTVQGIGTDIHSIGSTTQDWINGGTQADAGY